MPYAKQPVSIDGIEFDALMEESKTLEADVPSYPTEAGFSVSDSIILRPLTLSMTLFLTNTPVTWKAKHGASPSRVQDVLKQLEGLYFKKKLVTLSTSEKTYENMAIVSIELTKSKETGTSREIPITFQEIRITESQKTTIPASYGKSGATGKNAGTASTKTKGVSVSPASSAYMSSSASSAKDGGSKGSLLHSLGSAVGLTGDKKSGGGLGGIGGLVGGLFGGRS